MSLRDDLLEIERNLWSGSAEAYRSHLDDECLVAFPEMAGVFTRQQIAGSVEDSERWRDLEIHPEGLLRPLDDLAILTYRAGARRGEDGPYRALVSSGYARRDGEWKMVFHQQTPLTG